MKGWFSFYDAVTGEIQSRRYRGPEKFAAANAGEGFIPIAGQFDHLSQKVDIATGEVVDHQPPQPSPDHEWNGKRWVLTAEAQAALSSSNEAKSVIATQEAVSLRSIRELLLDPTNTDARQKLQDVEDAIVAVRSDVVKE